MTEDVKPEFKWDLSKARATINLEEYRYELKDIRDTTTGIKTLVEVFKDNKRIHKDVLCLASSKSRKTFGREAGDQKKITEHLLIVEEQLEAELCNLVSNRTSKQTLELTPTEVKEARELLLSPKLMFKIVEMMKALGVAGEENITLMHYLTFTSRITDHPLSIVVKGESSAGKSFVLSRLMLLIPPEAYEELTDATAQSFYYAAIDAYSHKIIVVFEKQGSFKTQNPIRTFQSEGKLRIQVTVKNPETNQFVTQVKEVKGPVGFITTTTHPNIHSENETRCFSVYPNESTEQTERILSVISKQYSKGHKKIDEEVLRPFHNLQKLLKPYPVIIPFTDAIEKAFPKNITRVRRDYSRFLALIEIIAILHQEQREKVNDEGVDKIVAALADYGCAWYISRYILARTIYGVGPKTEQVLEAMARIEEKNISKDAPLESVTINDIAKTLEWDTDTVAKWLKPAIKKGFVTVEEEAHGRKPGKFRLSKKELQKKLLPDPTELLLQTSTTIDTSCLVYNPLTGEEHVCSDGTEG